MMFPTLIACTRKEFVHILRDARTSLILLALPVMQVVLFGFALNTEVNHLRVGLVSSASGPVERELLVRLQGCGYFTITHQVNLREELNALFRTRQIDVAITVPDDFEASLLAGSTPSAQISIDASNPNVGRIGVAYIEQIVGDLIADLSARMPGAASGPPVRVDTRMMYNPTLRSTYNFVPGIMGLVLIIICSVMTSVSIVREREHRTIEILLVSPLRTRTLLTSKLIPYVVISYVNLLSILLLSRFALGVPIVGSLWLLWGISTIYILLALSIGLLISALVRVQSAAIIIAGIGMMLPTLMLSGMLFPISGMPRLLQYLSLCVPARWYIDAVRCVMIQGSGASEIWREIAALSGMLAVVATVALSIQRKRL